MRTLALLVSTTLAPALGFAQGNAELAQVQTIYLMPMANSFDQYLANRLRSISQIRIVTDPAKADAIFTDKIGNAFEARLEEMEAAIKEKQQQSTGEQKDMTPEQAKNEGFKFAPKMISSIGRGRGTFFLVDKRSRLVLWSTFQTAKDMQPRHLDDVAEKIAGALMKDFNGPKK